MNLASNVYQLERLFSGGKTGRGQEFQSTRCRLWEWSLAIRIGTGSFGVNFQASPVERSIRSTLQAEEGFDNLYGVDYSPSAIELCKQVAETEGHEGIQWSELDLTDVDGLREDFVASFDLILDKGTFDGVLSTRRYRFMRDSYALISFLSAITLAPKDEAAVKPTTL